MSHPSLQQKNCADQICNLIAGIKPFDAIEQEHIDETLAWVKSGAPIFRVQKPATPNKHFVSSAVIYRMRKNA